MEASVDPVAAIVEADARGEIADIFVDIRATLGVGVVNLVWRHLATMPGALQWVWAAAKPLYLGPAPLAADDLRRSMDMPSITPFSGDTLASAGLDNGACAAIRNVLDSYHHTNALALVVLSAILISVERKDNSAPRLSAVEVAGKPMPPMVLPRLTPINEMAPSLVRLIEELNRFGEDSDPTLVASMYRHLSHWPSYLALTRTLLAPLHYGGDLRRLVANAREVGERYGRSLSPVVLSTPPSELIASQAIAAVRRFATHPIARMTGVCALMRSAFPNESLDE